MAILYDQRRSRVKKESAYLSEFRQNITSQAGEDGIIKKIFDIMPPANKWCAEFGAGDGQTLSNSWRLLNRESWSGVMIESEPPRFNALDDLYADNENAHCFNRTVTLTGEDTLDAIFAETPIPNDFDFLSIDVDGMDWHIWSSLAQYRPRLVLIEFNQTIPNHIFYVQDDDPNTHHGSSLAAMVDLGKHLGYELIATTPLNAFFVVAEEFSKFGIDDNHIDAMHFTGKFESYLFQLYDGTLVLAGNDRLEWHNQPINIDDLQVLPKAERKFRG